MGYELQKVEGVERSPDFEEKKMKASEALGEKKKAQAKQKRALAKEGLDDAAAPLKRKPTRQINPQALVGKRIAVKWASKGGKNFMLTAGKTGPAEFYSGKILRFDSTKRRYQVTFDDQKSKKYDVNLTDPKSADYLPQKNWKRL